jgi:hypothetical protein
MGNIPRKYRIKTEKNYEKIKVEVEFEAGVTDGMEKKKNTWNERS